MSDRVLSLACGDYDRTRRLLDGTVGIEGYRLSAVTMRPEEMFRRAFDESEFDVCELSANLFLMNCGRRRCEYIGIPAFPSRAFRHSAIYVHSEGRIRRPENLRGSIVGVRSYGNTAALVVRGLLSDQYGVAAHEIAWRVGDVDRFERETIPIPHLAKSFDIAAMPRGTTLREALLSGDIDALIHYEPPMGFGSDGLAVKRLFDDPAAAERAFFQATGVFPIMHLVGVRRSLLENDPELAMKTYRAFSDAKASAMAALSSQSALQISLPWLSDHLATTVALAGEDFWPYGIASNQAALASLTRHSFEQGFTERRMSLEELFAPSVMCT